MRRVILLLVVVTGLTLFALSHRDSDQAEEPLTRSRGHVPSVTEKPESAPPFTPVPDRRSDMETKPEQTLGESPDSESGRFTVRVYGPDGKPVARATGRSLLRHGMQLSRVTWIVREGVGRFPLRQEGQSVVWIEVYGAVGAGAGLHRPVEPGIREVEIRLPAPRKISGVVVDDEGRGVPGVRIAARAMHPNEPPYLTSRRTPHAVTTSAEHGLFRLDGLGEFEYELRLAPTDGYAPAEPKMASSGDPSCRLVLRRTPEVVVTVLDFRGRPLTGAKVEITVRVGRVRTAATTDAEGQARFASVPMDVEVWLEVVPPDDREDVLGAELFDGLPPDGVVRLDRALPLAGTVVTADGRPIPHADILWRRAGSNGGGTIHAANEAGRFRIPRVPVTEIELRVLDGSAPDRTEGLPVTLALAGREDVVLRVGPTPYIALRIEDWPDQSAARAMLVFENQEGSSSCRARFVNRTVRFNGLRLDDVATVLVTGDDGTAWLGRGLRPKDEVQVVRGISKLKITGMVVGPPTGRRIAVTLELLPGRSFIGRMLASGRFEFAGVPAGDWKIRAFTSDEGEPWEGLAKAPAGSDVVIRLSPR
jgi:hypothetical protein